MNCETTCYHNAPQFKLPVNMAIAAYQLVPIINFIAHLVKGIITCQHRHTPVHEGKCFCPDCGKGVIYEWTVLKCSGCDKRRPSQSLMNRLYPSHRCCLQCGDTETYTDVLDNPWYYQLNQAQLLFTEDGSEHRHSESWTTVWVEPVFKGFLPAAT